MNNRIRLARGTAAKRNTSTEELVKGQLFLETDTQVLYNTATDAKRELRNATPINVAGSAKLGTTIGTSETTDRQPDHIFEENSNSVKNATLASNAINAIKYDSDKFAGFTFESDTHQINTPFGNIVLIKDLYKSDTGSYQVDLSEGLDIGDEIEVEYSIEKATDPTSPYESVRNVTRCKILSSNLNSVIKPVHDTNFSHSYTSDLGVTSITIWHLSFNILVRDISDNKITKIGSDTFIGGVFVKEMWERQSNINPITAPLVPSPISRSDASVIDDAKVKIYRVTKFIQ